MYVGKTEGNNTLQSCEVFAELKYWATSKDANHNETVCFSIVFKFKTEILTIVIFHIYSTFFLFLNILTLICSNQLNRYTLGVPTDVMQVVLALCIPPYFVLSLFAFGPEGRFSLLHAFLTLRAHLLPETEIS